MPPIPHKNTQNKVLNQFFVCAQCFAPFLKLPDIKALVTTSKACYKAFTDQQLWLSICNQNKLKFDITPITNPYTQLHICSPNLNVAAHWRFNQQLWESHNPQIYIDHSGNKNHLSCIPCPHPRGGHTPDHAIFAQLKDVQPLNAAEQFTAEVILCPCDLGSGREYDFPVLSKHGAAAGWEIRCNNSVISFLITPHPWSRHFEMIHHRKDPGKEVWMHIACTFDGHNMCLYVNGEKVEQELLGKKVKTLINYPAPFSIGFCQGWKDRCSFTGEIKEARICYKALQPDQFLKN